MKRKRGIEIFIGTFVLVFFTIVFLVSLEASAAKKEILIGGTTSQTGRHASDVNVYPKMMNTWAQMINERGGLWVKSEKKRLPVKFVLYDDKSDPANCIKFYERLVTVDKVDLLIGPYGSPLSFAASTVAEKYKFPMQVVCGTAKAIFDRGFKWIVGIDRIGAMWPQEYFKILAPMVKEGKAKTIALLAEDQIIFTEVIPGAAEYAKELGMEIVFNEKAATSTTDFTPIIMKMKEKNPDIVYVGAFPPFGSPFIKQCKEFDFNPKEFHISHFSVSFTEPLGKYAEYLTGDTWWVSGMKFGNYKMLEELQKRSGVSVSSEYLWASDRMVAFDSITQAIETAESLQPADLMKALKDVYIMATVGPVHYDEKGMGTNHPINVQFIGGKYTYAGPDSPGYPPAKHIYPKPKWSEYK